MSDQKKSKRPDHLWKKGQSGNPSGRSKVPRNVVALAREYTYEAMNTLIEIMEDPRAPHSSRVRAAESVLDRGYGKAAQVVNLNTNPLENMDEAELRVIAAALELVAGDGEGDASGASVTAH